MCKHPPHPLAAQAQRRALAAARAPRARQSLIRLLALAAAPALLAHTSRAALGCSRPATQRRLAPLHCPGQPSQLLVGRVSPHSLAQLVRKTASGALPALFLPSRASMRLSTQALHHSQPRRCAPRAQRARAQPPTSRSAPRAPQAPIRARAQPPAQAALPEQPTGSLASRAAPPYARRAPFRRLAQHRAPTAGQATPPVLRAPGLAVHVAPGLSSPARLQARARLALLAVSAALVLQPARHAPRRQAMVQASSHRLMAQLRACSAHLAPSRKTAASRAAACALRASVASTALRRAPLASTCQLARPTAWLRRPFQRETQPRASAAIMVPTFRRTGRPARPLRLQPLSCRCLRLAAPRRSLPWQA